MQPLIGRILLVSSARKVSLPDVLLEVIGVKCPNNGKNPVE